MTTVDLKQANEETRDAWEQNAAYWDEHIGKGNDFVNVLIWPATQQLLERCLGEFTDVWLTAKAVQSLGQMYERSYKDLFERIALGDFEGIASSKKASKWDNKYLQRKAIEALANIGDRDTLTRLRTHRTDWGPELERVFYWTSEEIYWRLGPGGGQ